MNLKFLFKISNDENRVLLALLLLFKHTHIQLLTETAYNYYKSGIFTLI